MLKVFRVRVLQFGVQSPYLIPSHLQEAELKKGSKAGTTMVTQPPPYGDAEPILVQNPTKVHNLKQQIELPPDGNLVPQG